MAEQNTHKIVVAAETAGHDVHTSTGHAEGGHKAGFPPFDSSTFAPQLVWLALTFTLLYVMMSRVALPRIGEVIEERRDRIQRDLDQAERLKAETEKALNDYETSLADARAKSSAIAREQRDKLSAETERERAEADAKVQATIAEAEARISDMKGKALASVNDIAAETASAIVSKLIGEEVSADDVRQAL